MLTFVPNIFLNSSSTAAISALIEGFLFLRSGLASSFIFSVSLSAALTDSPFLTILSHTSSCFFSSLIVIIVLPCAAEMRPSIIIFLIFSGSFRSLSELAIYALLFPNAFDTCSCVNSKRLIISLSPSASSIGSRFSRCIFSMIATIIFCFSSKFLIMQGTFLSSAILAARHLLSPATSS